ISKGLREGFASPEDGATSRRVGCDVAPLGPTERTDRGLAWVRSGSRGCRPGLDDLAPSGLLVCPLNQTAERRVRFKGGWEPRRGRPGRNPVTATRSWRSARPWPVVWVAWFRERLPMNPDSLDRSRHPAC